MDEARTRYTKCNPRRALRTCAPRPFAPPVPLARISRPPNATSIDRHSPREADRAEIGDRLQGVLALRRSVGARSRRVLAMRPRVQKSLQLKCERRREAGQARHAPGARSKECRVWIARQIEASLIVRSTDPRGLSPARLVHTDARMVTCGPQWSSMRKPSCTRGAEPGPGSGRLHAVTLVRVGVQASTSRHSGPLRRSPHATNKMPGARSRHDVSHTF